jgi:DNA-binding CsgD family transcriptional regulator
MAVSKRTNSFSMTELDNIAVMKRFIGEVWNKKKISTIEEILSPHFVAHYEYGVIKGPEQWKESHFDIFCKAIPDLFIVVDEYLPRGVNVITRWKAKGTHKGKLLGVSSTGEPIEIKGITWTKIFDGRIVEDWTNWDMSRMLMGDKAKSLEDMNTALRVLLDQREKDKAHTEENMVSSVNDLVLPYITKLKNTSLNNAQLSLIAIIESNLYNFVKPFARHLASKLYNLTPMEIKVADLIRNGHSNKEIAEILSVSKSTVLTHRHHLREKMGLRNKKINLQSHLLSLD